MWKKDSIEESGGDKERSIYYWSKTVKIQLTGRESQNGRIIFISYIVIKSFPLLSFLTFSIFHFLLNKRFLLGFVLHNNS